MASSTEQVPKEDEVENGGYPAEEGEGAESGDEAAAADGAGGKKKPRRRKKKAAKEPEAPVELRPGVEVLIQGLTGAVELNGQRGQCQDFNEEKGRWNVRMPGGEIKALKPDNLIPQAPVQVEAPKTNAKAKSSKDFNAWVEKALKEVPSGVNNLSSADRLAMHSEFSDYQFSGTLRPAYVTPQMDAPPCNALPDYANHPEGESASESSLSNGRRGAVPVVEGDDLLTMREACRFGREVLDAAGRFMKAGVTGDEIDRIVWQACVDRKVYPSPLNYMGFPKSVCVSPNEVICHGIPDCRPLKEGEIVNLDVSIYHKGFHADLNETFFIGQCDEESQNLVCTAYNALKAASEMIRPGAFYRDVGGVVQTVAVKGGCSIVTSYCGHGVGRLFHGPPDVPHYRKNKAVGIMKAGHIFTVEPMLNVGGKGGDTTWPDDWTAVTTDGNRSAQFEHTFLVTENGCELLTARPGTNVMAMPEYKAADFQR